MNQFLTITHDDLSERVKSLSGYTDVSQGQPSTSAFLALSILDSTVSCDVTGKYALTTGQDRTPRD